MSKSFTCQDCDATFELKPEILAKYPNWTPRQCMKCKSAASGGKKKKAPARKRGGKRPGKSVEQNLPLAEVLLRYTEGPHEGIFTDGACKGNPGPGGWGMVWVKNNEVVTQEYGHEAKTTNNRMEMAALIAAYKALPEDEEVTIWSDSNLCVQTINDWARSWKRMGWKRKTGAVVNLDLVEPAYELSLRRPKAKLRWIKAHNGSRWNEYADALATAFQRDEL